MAPQPIVPQFPDEWPDMRKALDYLTSIPTVIAFTLTFLLGDVALRMSTPFGVRAMEWTVGVVQKVLLLCFLPSGIKVKVDRHSNVNEHKGYIFIANHQSLLDVPIFGGLLFSNFPKYVGKVELGRGLPLVSYNMRHTGNVLIERGSGIEAIEQIQEFARTCQERDVAPVIFPEGSRSRDGQLKPFRPGGTVAIMQAAPEMMVVPTTIDGSWRILERKMWPIPFGTELQVKFHEPIPQAGRPPFEIIKECRALIEGTLEEWRADE
jgi:1-acyl-sn-glycerol-3-phosphate acyltransferase